jgi:hypothetical protein
MSEFKESFMWGFLLFCLVIAFFPFLTLANANIVNTDLLFVFQFMYVIGFFWVMYKMFTSLLS